MHNHLVLHFSLILLWNSLFDLHDRLLSFISEKACQWINVYNEKGRKRLIMRIEQNKTIISPVKHFDLFSTRVLLDDWACCMLRSKRWLGNVSICQRATVVAGCEIPLLPCKALSPPHWLTMEKANPTPTSSGPHHQHQRVYQTRKWFLAIVHSLRWCRNNIRQETV